MWRSGYYAGGQRIAERVGDSTLYFLLGDHLGSTSITANSSGALVAEVRYTPWGETRYASGTTPTTLRYTGQREEAALGLYYFNARWLDPASGRFLSADSIVPEPGNPQAFNRYSLVYNNPLRYTDPTGHMPWDGCDIEGCVAETDAAETSDSANSLEDGLDGDPASTADTELIGMVATLFDLAAAGTNALYAGAMLGVSTVYPPAAVPFAIGYQAFMFIPNAFSTVSMVMWIAQGTITGENQISLSNDGFSVSVSQDTMAAVASNAAGWLLIKDPLTATAVDTAVLSYDVARNPNPIQPGNPAPWIIPTFMNPTLSYSRSGGFHFSFSKP